MKFLIRILLLTKFARYRTIIGAAAFVAVQLIKEVLCAPAVQAVVPQFVQGCTLATPFLDLLQYAATYAVGVGLVDKRAAVGRLLKIAPGPNPPSPYFPQDQFRPGA